MKITPPVQAVLISIAFIAGIIFFPYYTSITSYAIIDSSGDLISNDVQCPIRAEESTYLPVITAGWRSQAYADDPRYPSIHNGVDIGVPCGTPIHAFAEGDVTYGGAVNGSCGYTAEINHGDGVVTKYCHIQAHSNSPRHVDQGDKIGLVGDTGNVACHLHFELSNQGGDGNLNPLDYRCKEFPCQTGWCSFGEGGGFDPIVTDSSGAGGVDDGIEYKFKPTFNFALDYNMNFYDTLSLGAATLYNACKNSADKKACLESNAGPGVYIGACQPDHPLELFYELIELYQNCDSKEETMEPCSCGEYDIEKIRDLGYKIVTEKSNDGLLLFKLYKDDELKAIEAVPGGNFGIINEATPPFYGYDLPPIGEEKEITCDGVCDNGPPLMIRYNKGASFAHNNIKASVTEVCKQKDYKFRVCVEDNSNLQRFDPVLDQQVSGPIEYKFSLVFPTCDLSRFDVTDPASVAIRDLVIEMAAERGIPCELALSVASYESGFTQFNPDGTTKQNLNVKPNGDPEVCIFSNLQGTQSVDSGIMQINNCANPRYFPPTSFLSGLPLICDASIDIECNIRVGLDKLISNYNYCSTRSDNQRTLSCDNRVYDNENWECAVKRYNGWACESDYVGLIAAEGAEEYLS